MLVGIDNVDPALVILEVETTIDFWNAPPSQAGKGADNLVTTLQWKLLLFDGSAWGTFEGNKAPTPYWTANTVVTKVLQLQ
ncbi:hypothetical protein GVN24_26405 [Rhizobium sp. CRIBSB]|nr:hypothetical protein [Rhizobium sp. CRIBSB]